MADYKGAARKAAENRSGKTSLSRIDRAEQRAVNPSAGKKKAPVKAATPKPEKNIRKKIDDDFWG